MKTKLDTREARTDLSSRDCAKIIGATLGGLIQMADSRQSIRAALVWWLENFDDAFPPEA